MIDDLCYVMPGSLSHTHTHLTVSESVNTFLGTKRIFILSNSPVFQLASVLLVGAARTLYNPGHYTGR